MDRAPEQRKAVLTTHQLVYRFEGGFELRPGRELLRHGSPVPIGGTALELLRLLLAARGDLVTKDELFEALWSDVDVVENTLHPHIGALRKALGERAELIGTVPATPGSAATPPAASPTATGPTPRAKCCASSPSTRAARPDDPAGARDSAASTSA